MHARAFRWPVEHEYCEDSRTYQAAEEALDQHGYCPVILSHQGSAASFPSLSYHWYYDVNLLRSLGSGVKKTFLLIDPRGLDGGKAMLDGRQANPATTTVNSSLQMH